MKFLKRAGLAACAVLLGLCGCMGGGADNGGHGDIEILSVAFTASEEVMDITETTTLKMYMEAMAGNGGIEYEESGGMITSVFGVEPGENECWFIYTSLEDYSNEAWGTFVYRGQTLGSATLGYELLPCVEGEVYVLALSAW